MLPNRPSPITLPPNLGRFSDKLHVVHLDDPSPSVAAQAAALSHRMTSFWDVRQAQRERQAKGLEPDEGIATELPRVVSGAMAALMRAQTVAAIRACNAGDGEGMRLGMDAVVSRKQSASCSLKALG